MSFLVYKCFFTIDNMVFKQQDILIYQWVLIQHHFEPTSLFLYFFKSKYIKQFISNEPHKACKYLLVSRFIDGFCVITDDKEFLTSFENIYPKELQVSVEHQGNHASFLDLDIKIRDVLVYKLDEKRDK